MNCQTVTGKAGTNFCHWILSKIREELIDPATWLVFARSPTRITDPSVSPAVRRESPMGGFE